MQRRLGQMVALILAIAGIMNAQCLASCAALSATSSNHACCPHHGNSSGPCSHTTAEMRGSAAVPAPPVTAAVVPVVLELLSPQFHISGTPERAVIPDRKLLRSPSGILRI